MRVLRKIKIRRVLKRADEALTVAVFLLARVYIRIFGYENFYSLLIVFALLEDCQ